ncbi:MAG: HAMP domain-containing histidine kinase [Gammaproteobacteria bacterium]|nr:HAMP domain-containing histidine kinase [Gammaproteobacteria bacterium]MDH4256097.1 HAMP domain-containing histidine kinase [Gammaproteobacteria bacterium]MDH5310231.1 HAMP domain-containing histidine kinase [Gammaproteobacteria bacterium]
MSRTFRLTDYDPGRLRLLLGLVFLLLALPTAALLWQAWGQLKWEAWYQYRGQAEELTGRIDRQLAAAVATAEARTFADFAFAKAAGDPAGRLLERSPLAGWPVVEDVPGAIGYFQVGTDGEFSTPLLPGDDAAAGAFGIAAGELAARQSLVREIQAVLADNRLLRDRGPIPGTDPGLQRAAAADDLPADAAGLADAIVVTGGRSAEAEATPAASVPSAIGASLESADEMPAEEQAPAASPGEAYNQQAFDELNAPKRQALPSAAESEPAATALYGKLEDLKLDEGLQKRSESREQKDARPAELAGREDDDARVRRNERSVLPAAPAAVVPAETLPEAESADKVRIDTFASEIDPYEFSLLDSGHLVLFRTVWRDGARYIQGILLDRERFIEETAAAAFRPTSLATMSDLVVGYRSNIIGVLRGREARSYPASAGDLDGSLLYRGRLSAPFDGIELVYSVKRLPAGPGAGVLGWTAAVLAVVFLLGYAALYRLGLGQIRLARQQQDFVSAVSHELKTPLTSIRMYGEMLKEGWADEQKKKQYYEYIHDESERLTRLISNVLQLARITRNEPQFAPKPVSVAELLDTVRSKIASQAERAGFELDIRVDADAAPAVLDIDVDCFAQIVINLVDNAIKFSRQAEIKRIEIAAARRGRESIVVSVRDHGPGIPKDQMKKIFRLFYRPRSELTRETVGTGIGLAIVHQLAQAMGGSVDVVNREPGAEFRVGLPARL